MPITPWSDQPHLSISERSAGISWPQPRPAEVLAAGAAVLAEPSEVAARPHAVVAVQPPGAAAVEVPLHEAAAKAVPFAEQDAAAVVAALPPGAAAAEVPLHEAAAKAVPFAEQDVAAAVVAELLAAVPAVSEVSGQLAEPAWGAARPWAWTAVAAEQAGAAWQLQARPSI
jgi:hypothetical protein